MCPALMFAAKRKERVIGRTRVLTVSIRIRNGFSQEGAPPGRRDARVVEGLNFILDIRRLSHRGSPRTKVKNRCEEDLNTKGSTPIKLIEIIKINSAVKMSVRPFKCVVVVRVLCSAIVLVKIERIQKDWFGEDQNNGWIRVIVIAFINQKRVGERLKVVVVAGSKDEKMSIIIKT